MANENIRQVKSAGRQYIFGEILSMSNKKIYMNLTQKKINHTGTKEIEERPRMRTSQVKLIGIIFRDLKLIIAHFRFPPNTLVLICNTPPHHIMDDLYILVSDNCTSLKNKPFFKRLIMVIIAYDYTNFGLFPKVPSSCCVFSISQCILND